MVGYNQRETLTKSPLNEIFMFVDEVQVRETESKVCCPLFKTEAWNNVTHSWSEKRFLQDSVPEVFHIPLPGSFKKAVARMWKKAEAAGAAPDRKDFLLLTYDPSAFKGELYMAVTKDVPGEQTVKLSGNFFSQVFEGSYGDIRKFLHHANDFLAADKMVSWKDYIYFPYCPKCAKKYGHNFIVVISQVGPLLK